MFKTSMTVEIIGSRHLLKKRLGDIYRIVDQGNGVIKFGNQKFLLHEIQTEDKYKRNVGTAAAGAVVGGLLTGGVGAVVGGAIGGMRKKDSVYYATLEDMKSGSTFTVQMKIASGSGSIDKVSSFSTHI